MMNDKIWVISYRSTCSGNSNDRHLYGFYYNEFEAKDFCLIYNKEQDGYYYSYSSLNLII